MMHRHKRFGSYLIVLATSILGALGAIITAPHNQVLLEGEEFNLICTSDTYSFDNIIWYRLGSDGTQILSLRGCLIFTFIPYPYEITGNGNTCELRVANTSSLEAGLYQCYVSGTPVETASSSLSILGKEPSLTVDNDNVTSGEHVTLEFSVEYDGAITPELIWNPPSGIVDDITQTALPGGMLYSIRITSYTAGTYDLSCGVRFRANSVVTDASDVEYSSGNNVTVTFNYLPPLGV